jgi:hypothetical protein
MFLLTCGLGHGMWRRNPSLDGASREHTPFVMNCRLSHANPARPAIHPGKELQF